MMNLVVSIRILPTSMIVFFFLAGCVASVKQYPGPERPEAEISTILADENTRIRSIDEQRFGGPPQKKFQILPGDHTLKAKLKIAYRSADKAYTSTKDVMIFKFHSEPGKTYLVKSTFIEKENRVSFSIVDTSSNQVVSQILGSEFDW